MTTPRNHGREWTSSDDSTLAVLASMNVDTTDIASILGRTEAAIRAEASREDISLLPKDKS